MTERTPELRRRVEAAVEEAPGSPAASAPTAPQHRRLEALIGLVVFAAQRLAFGVLVLITITYKLDNRLIVVMAQYDSPPPDPTGEPYPAANDDASGVAVMLEAIRAMQESGYQPYKTFLFVAYAGEGWEGSGRVPRPEVANLLQARRGFSSAFEVEAVVDLRGLGSAGGDGLVLSAGGSLRLANLFEQAARQMGVKVQRAREAVDISIVFEDKELEEGGQKAPTVGLSWEGWEATSRMETDTLESLSADKLERAGRALALALMILGRETQY